MMKAEDMRIQLRPEIRKEVEQLVEKFAVQLQGDTPESLFVSVAVLEKLIVDEVTFRMAQQYGRKRQELFPSETDPLPF